MSTTEKAEVKLGADTTELAAGMEKGAVTTEATTAKMTESVQAMAIKSTEAVKGMQATMQHSFDEIGHTVHKVTSIFGLMTAAMVGGAAFGHIISETNAWTGEVVKLSKGLGITTEEASGLAVALNHVGASGETFVDAAKKLDRQIAKNEDSLNKMGMATRDSGHHLLDQKELMMNAINTLLGYEAGTSRNMAAQKLFGRGAGDLNALLKLTPEILEHAEHRAKELHLIVGPEGVKQMRAYKEGMADVKEIAHSVEVQMGNALMPVLTSLGSWFSAIGPQAIELFKGAINGVITFIMMLGLGTVTAFELIKAAVSELATYAVAAYKAIGQAMTGDFSGALATLEEGYKEAGETGEAAMLKIEKATKDTNDSLAKLWGLKKPTAALDTPDAPKKKEFDTNIGKPAKEVESRVPQWKADLDEMKLAEDAFLSSSLKADLDYWTKKSKDAKLTVEESNSVNHEILRLKKEIQKEDLANDLEGIKLRIAAEKTGSAERITIQEAAIKKIAAAYGTDSKEYKAALGEKEKLAREHEQLLVHLADSITDKDREINRLGLDIERDNAAHRKAMGEIDAEDELQIHRNLELRKSAIDRAALDEKLALEKQGTLEYQKLLNQIEVEEAKHSQKMLQIDHQLAQEQKKTWDTVTQSIQKSLTAAFQGMMNGSMKLAQAVKMVAGNILNTFIELGVKMFLDWARKQIMMTVFHEGQTAVRSATEASAAVTSVATTAAANVSKATSDTAVAAIGAASSQASIPYVGPILAAAAAASMTAMGAGYIAMASAAGGWDRIPGDQIIQAHQDEMVLPAELAEGVRQMVGKGDQGKQQQQGGGGSIHIHATDARSVKRLFADNGGNIAGALTKQTRNFRGYKS